MIYVTPMAVQKTYLADEISGIQGATDSNVVWGQSTLGSYPMEQIIAAKNGNVYYFTNGPGPVPPPLPQPPIVNVAGASGNPILVTIAGTAPPTGTQLVITGNSAANGTWIITNTGLSTFTLNGSTSTGATVNGGTYQLTQYQQAPFSIYQIYLCNNDSINRSLIDRAKSSGYKVLFLTIDASPSHITDRMQDLGSSPNATSTYAGTNFFTDPVFNYTLYTTAGFNVVATQDPTILQYTSVKTSTPISTLQAAYNINRAMDFLVVIVTPGIRAVNTSTSGPLFPFSVTNISNYAHSAVALGDPLLTATYPTQYPATTAQLPLLVKGCTNVQDALLIQSAGSDGVVVSNHGGRFADLSISSLDALVAIKPAVKAVNPNFAVWFDSGIRRGPDILVAYACGAEFVGVGRPCIYANIINGRQGTRQITAQLVGMARRAAQTVGLPDFESTTFANLPTPIIKPAAAPNQNHNLWT